MKQLGRSQANEVAMLGKDSRGGRGCLDKAARAGKDSQFTWPLQNGATIMPTAVHLAEKLGAFSEHWSPKIVAKFNGHDVMVVKAKGEFVWHSHAETDDFFFVLKGNLVIQLREAEVRLGPGDLYVVPQGVEHRPVAEEEVHLLLIEPQGTPNTGDAATAAVKHAI